MSVSEASLPPGFETLEPFVGAWAVAGSNNRLQRRLTSSAAERLAFFEAAKDLLPSALSRLDQKPLAEFDDRETRLMNLLLSMAHVSLAVETQGDDEARHAEGARHMTITRAPADLQAWSPARSSQGTRVP